MSKGFTVFLGVAELAGGLGRGFFCAYSIGWAGIDSDHGGRHLQEIFMWHTGFRGEKTYGWHHDLMIVMMNLAILFTGGGRWY